MKKELVKLLKEKNFDFTIDDIVEPKTQGHDNHTYIIENTYTVKIPTAQEYSRQLIIEKDYLPVIKNQVSCKIPEQILLGEKNSFFPFGWSLNKYIKGEVASELLEISELDFSISLAKCLNEFKNVKLPNSYPTPDKNNFFRGGSLKKYKNQFQKSIKIIKNEKTYSSEKIKLIKLIFKKAIKSKKYYNVQLVHGDINPTNIIVDKNNSNVIAIIDFGQTSYGDPSCDYSIGWTFLSLKARKLFFKELNLNEGLINVARGWAIWKAAITLTGNSSEILQKQAKKVFKEVLLDVDGTK